MSVANVTAGAGITEAWGDSVADAINALDLEHRETFTSTGTAGVPTAQSKAHPIGAGLPADLVSCNVWYLGSSGEAIPGTGIQVDGDVVYFTVPGAATTTITIRYKP